MDEWEKLHVYLLRVISGIESSATHLGLLSEKTKKWGILSHSLSLHVPHTQHLRNYQIFFISLTTQVLFFLSFLILSLLLFSPLFSFLVLRKEKLVRLYFFPPKEIQAH